uniref:Uncharacterized protein n=1 Tax=Alexandrium andersonii TaxID=327968 RepID=A0A7S2D374_9DINO
MALVPFAAPKVLTMVQTSLDDLGRVVSAYRDTVPLVVSAVEDVAFGRVGCSASPSQHRLNSGAAPSAAGARLFLGLVLAALGSAWASSVA